jgi:hypothetical protein
MSETLPSANKPSLGGRVARAAGAAARSTLRLGSAAFNKMFPTLGKVIGGSKKPGEEEEINTSSEDISRNLFKQKALTRTILENQQEQNRLLEKLLMLYTTNNSQLARPSVMGAPPPPTPGGPDPDLSLPDLDREERKQRRNAQRQQQRPATSPQQPQQRPSVASRVTPSIRTGVRLATRFGGPVAFFTILTEGLSRLGEQSVWLSTSTRTSLTRTIGSLQANIEDFRRKLEELQNEEDDQKAEELNQDLEFLLQSILRQRDNIVSMAANLDADLVRETRRRRRRGETQSPTRFTFTESTAQLVGQVSSLVPQMPDEPESLEIPADLESTGVIPRSTMTPSSPNRQPTNTQTDGSRVESETQQAPAATPVSRDSVSIPGATTSPTPPSQPANVTGTTAQILATIRRRESNGNYQALARGGSSASGAYQFIDSTWRAVTQRFNIGTQYPRAAAAPPEVQDAVAAAYVNDILRQNGGNVAAVPLVWYTGNPQGRMSAATLAANNGLTPEMYQRNWLAEFARQGGTAPTLVASEPQQAPAAGPALSQSSMQRVVADRQQASNTQKIVAEFKQKPPATQLTQQLAQQAQQQVTLKQEAAEVPLRTRILYAFQQLARTA